MDPEDQNIDAGTDQQPAEGASEAVDLDAELASAIDAGIEEASGGTPSNTESDDEQPGAGASESAEDDPEGDDKDSVEKPDKDAGKKKTEPDHVNDPIPEEIKGRTRERIESLVGQVKELRQVETRYNEIMGMIAETRATPEQYGMVLEYLGAVNSGDPEQIRGAMQILQRELDALSEALGEPAPGKDPLEGHQDLQDAVEVGDLTRKHAEEIAAARNQRKALERQRQASTQQSEAQRALAAARQTLNALDEELKAQDPHYAQKRQVLIGILQPVFKQIPPSQWVATFKAAYAKLPDPPAAAPPQNTGGAGNANQPLRSRQPAGGQQKQPTTLEEAIDFGIKQAGR